MIPNEVISQIEEITAREDGAKLADHLPEDVAQSFVDVVHEVRPDGPSLPGHSVLSLVAPVLFLKSRLLGFRSS